jgi:hypothetical protein
MQIMTNDEILASNGLGYAEEKINKYTIATRAFLAAQLEIKSPTKDSKNPHFKNTYASLGAVIDACKPILNKHGFYITQSCEASRTAGFIDVLTRFEHVDGGSVECVVAVPVGKLDPQGGMGAFTYGRRYGLLAALSLAAEDDDANEASLPAAKTAPPAVPAKPVVNFVGVKK